MRERKLKIRFFIDYEKEEKWVNLMAVKGWNLYSFGLGYYTFEKGDPGQYIYRNEMIHNLGVKDERDEYINFLQSSGVELVKVFFNWAYFRKKASEGPFELYSDITSKLAYQKRICKLFLIAFFINVVAGISNLILEEKFNHYTGLVNIGLAVILLIPLLKVLRKQRNLKQQLTIFND
ncbi:DUF2812 domain-containing protein [Ureibacillus chungkukjangi]|uniref:Uncharacterized protein DUF2812 n=1 Tax=Ureibacillus chungkukjangi TaxID=1202712 RepID=A0A318TWG1_9BACL|nr:DUF2812 domain-containing protein [Ureibacillus chungkukjangi]MCM3388405.1 DUF2812 domain-containing protein [Ureibacillus chungkukjangi]PYF07348.1 uncharacterized protein DUF2812 [Ureibacillus chungkukjangi]